MIQSAQYSVFEFGDSISAQGIHSVIPEKPITNIPKKNNRFSTLVKSSEEGFLLSTRSVNVPESEKIFIEEKEPGHFSWLLTGESYSCVVT